MTKALLLVLLIASVVLNFYLYERERNLNNEFNLAIESLETQEDDLKMFTGMISDFNPKRSQVIDYFEEFYPSDSLGPYTSQVVWRDHNFFFTKDSTLHMMSYSSSPEWVCGTFIGCESNLRFELPEILYSPLLEKMEWLLFNFPYSYLFGFFLIIFFFQIKSRNSSSPQKTYLMAYLMLLTGFIFTNFTAFLWLEDVMFTDISRSLLVASWNEIQYQFLISLILSFIVPGIGIITNKFISVKENSYE